MRLFVAVWPPEDVLDRVGEVVAALQDHPDGPEARWATRAQWHVTLRFLGEVADPDEVVEALETLGHPDSSSGASQPSRRLAPVEAELGPVAQLLGDSVLCLPVTGLADLAQAVTAATGGVGRPVEPRPFRGHVTLARLRGTGRDRRRGRKDQLRQQRAAALQAARWLETWRPDQSATVRWPVQEIQLLRSHLGHDGSLYETLWAMALRS